jgi:hypothetical protein
LLCCKKDAKITFRSIFKNKDIFSLRFSDTGFFTIFGAEKISFWKILRGSNELRHKNKMSIK